MSGGFGSQGFQRAGFRVQSAGVARVMIFLYVSGTLVGLMVGQHFSPVSTLQHVNVFEMH